MIVKTFKTKEELINFFGNLNTYETVFNQGREVCPKLRKALKIKDVTPCIKFLISDKSLCRVLAVNTGKSVHYWFGNEDVDLYINNFKNVK